MRGGKAEAKSQRQPLCPHPRLSLQSAFPSPTCMREKVEPTKRRRRVRARLLLWFNDLDVGLWRIAFGGDPRNAMNIAYRLSFLAMKNLAFIGLRQRTRH